MKAIKTIGAMALCAAALPLAAIAADATLFRVECDRPDALYRLGQVATFTVEAAEKDGSRPAGTAHVRLDNFGDRVFMEYDVDLAKSARFTVTGQMDRAGFLMLRVSKEGGAAKLFGVAYEPEKLRPCRECPADFDEFWAEAIRKYDAEVTAPIKATKVDPGRVKGRDLYEIEIPAVGNRTVWGYLSVPSDASKGPFPLVVRVPGAGPATFCEEGSDSKVLLFVNVHYYKPRRGLRYKCPEHLAMQKVEDEAYAKKYPVKAARYTNCGIAASREDYFYYGVILAANRAIDWAAARPDVDKARVRYTGGSQGGGFGLILTGLNKRIRRAAVTVPAMTDHLCFKIDGREAGWPRLIDAQLPANRAAAEANAPYFDALYFAQRIDVPIRFNVGFADTVCPPHAGYAAYNICPSGDKLMRYGIGQDHTPLSEIRQEFAKWLENDAPLRLGVSAYDGWLTFPGGRITLAAFLPGWNAVSVKPGEPAADGGARPFTVPLPDGTAAFKGRVGWSARPDGTVAGNVRLECVKAVEMECLALSASVPSRPESGLGDSTVSRYVMPASGGRRLALEFPSPMRCHAQDSRKWGGQWGVRFSGRENRRKYSPGDVVEWDVTLAPADGAALELAMGRPYTAGEKNGWTRLEYRRDVKAGSALDFSRMGLQDGTAGKHGWLKSVGGRFEFEGLPGKAQKFYGVNLCQSANYPTHELADRLAARLAMCGYNAVRVHHQDGMWKADEDGARERLDYLLARLFERGIYVTTDLYVSRPVTWREVGIDRDGKMDYALYKAYVGISDAAFADWCRNAREFLEHVNPYTGRAYRDEPGLPFVSLVNEGNLGMGWARAKMRDDPLVRAAWREFCAETGVPPDKAGDGPGHSPDDGFEEWVNRRVWERCSAFARSLGCRALLSNDNAGRRHGEGEGLTPLYDYVDSHFYVDHPKFLGKPWSLPIRIGGTSPVTVGGPDIFRRGWAKGASKPYTITEWNFCGPGRFRGVGGLLTGAFAAEQEWDGLWRFAYSHSDRGMDGDISYAAPGTFNIADDPLTAASDRAVVCLYLRGDAEAGSLRLDKEAGSAAVVSPRTCGGFAERGAVEAGALSFALHGESPATVWASSVDAEPTPLSRARRILVAHLTDVQGNGAQFADESRQVVMKWGRGCLAANGRADVTLALDGPARPKVYALRFDGSRRGEVASTFDGGRLSFVADTARDVADATCLYEIVR